MRNVCAVDGCDRDVVGQGWCNKHYKRWKATGDPLKTKKRGVKIGMRRCSVSGCLRKHHAHGYCQLHQRRVKKAGNPGEVRPGRRGGDWSDPPLAQFRPGIAAALALETEAARVDALLGLRVKG